EPGAPLLLADLGPDAALTSLLSELPFGVGQLPGDALDVVAILLVGRVGAVRAAALHQLGRGLGEHALAALPEDALPRRREERDVALPALPFLAAGRDRHPLAIRWSQEGLSFPLASQHAEVSAVRRRSKASVGSPPSIPRMRSSTISTPRSVPTGRA